MRTTCLKEKTEEVPCQISTGQFMLYFPITVERANSVGLPISMERPETIYRLMDLFPQKGGGTKEVLTPKDRED